MLVSLAIVLLVLVVIFVPRPNIRLTNVRYETGSCDPVTSSVVATAYVTLTNTGGADGDVFVRFYVDGQRRETGDFLVPARASVERSLSVVITDCASHHYSVDTCLAAAESPAC